MVECISVNCQGLGDYKKRKDVFQYLRNFKANVYCLQDTHFTKNIETQIITEWGSHCLFSSYTSNARGVCVMFNTNFDYKIEKVSEDESGNFLIIQFTTDEKKITLCTLYGPNVDNPDFYTNISNKLQDFEQDNLILCGDFNLILDPKVDCFNYLHVNNPRARNKLLNLKTEIGMIDPYRETNPNTRRYTWRKRTPLKQARLDFFLITEQLLTSLESCTIESSYRSDHSIIKLKLKFNEFKRGKGLWKFNNSLLYDSAYLETINELITSVMTQYAVPVYNFENLDNMDLSTLQLSVNDQLFLETLLMEIRGKSISYASYKKKSLNEKESNLQLEIKTLEENLNIQNNDIVIQKKMELEASRKNRIEGSIIRSRAKWLSEGEKPSKYFLNLESRNYVNKTIPRLDVNGKIIDNQTEILKETQKFYADLYSERTDIDDIDLHDTFADIDVPKLSDADKAKLDGPITLEEASVVLKNMKSDKSPGSDGFTSEFFKVFWKRLGPFVTRSLNYGQGDPISPYLFILCAEILSIKIRNDKDIKGISVDRFEYKISQYADDTTLLLDGSEKSLHRSLQILQWFEKISGLKVNFEKTQLVWIGSKKYSNDRLCHQWNLIWGQTKFKLLGVNFDVNLENICELNYREKLHKMETIIKQWKKRNLTPVGKISLIKSLLISQFNHLFISLPDPSDKLIKEMRNTMFEFLWNNKPDKIKRDTLCADFDEGGLKMIDIKAFIMALKSTWIRKILNSEGIWQNLLFQNVNKAFLLQCGEKYLDEYINKNKNAFWTDVFKAWKELRNKESKENIQNLANKPIWMNNDIKIGGNCVFYKHWYRNGIVFINDLLKIDNTFYNFDEILNILGLRINFLEYEGILSAVRKLKTSFTGSYVEKINGPFQPSSIVTVLKSKKGAQDMYKVLCKKKLNINSQRKWQEKIADIDAVDWKNIYKSIGLITSTKLRWFQYRINHNILTTNKTAFKMKILHDPMCTFCDSDEETICHLFWECPIVQNLYSQFHGLLREFNTDIDLDRKKIILGPYCSKYSAENVIILHLKFFIYRTKCTKDRLSITSWKYYMKSMYKAYKTMFQKNRQFDIFQREWRSFIPLFENMND